MIFKTILFTLLLSGGLVDQYVLIELNDGRKIKGTVTELNKQTITLNRGGVTLTFQRNQIRKLTKKTKPQPETLTTPEPPDAPPPQDDKPEPVTQPDLSPEQEYKPETNSKKDEESRKNPHRLIHQLISQLSKSEDLEPKNTATAWIKMGSDPSSSIRKAYGKLNDSTSRVIYFLFKNHASKNIDNWEWFLRNGQGDSFEKAVNRLSSTIDKSKALELLVKTLITPDKAKGQVLRDSCLLTAAKFNVEQCEKIKPFLMSRLTTGKKSAQLCILRILTEDPFGLSPREWTTLLNSKSDAIRIQALFIAEKQKLQIDPGYLQLKLDTEMPEEEWTAYLKLVNVQNFPVLIPEQNLYKLLVKARSSKNRPFRKIVHQRLKQDTEETWALSSKNWDEYFDQ